MEFTTDFILYPEQSFTTIEAMTAHSNEVGSGSADFEYGHDRQRAVQQAWEEIRVARQAFIDRPILEAEFPPLFDDAEQSGEMCDIGDGEYHECPWFGCDMANEEEEDQNPIKEKYMQEFPLQTFNLLLTEPLSPETLATIEPKTNIKPPNSSPGSANHEDRGGAPLTPEQIDQLLVFWGNSELVEQHHHSRLIGDPDREDRITAMPFLERTSWL